MKLYRCLRALGLAGLTLTTFPLFAQLDDASERATFVPPGLQVLTFDDLDPGPEHAPIPSRYGGLQWSNFRVLNGTALSADYGYRAGVVSGSNVAFNASGNPASISRFGSFDLLSAHLTAAWNLDDEVRIRVEGFRGGSLVYSNDYTVNRRAPTRANLNFRDVDNVRFVSSPSTVFAMDNVTVVISAPERTPEISIEATAPETTEPTTNSAGPPGSFRITRAGDNREAMTVYVEYSGTATLTADYANPGQFFTLAPGQTTREIPIFSRFDEFLENDEAVIATLESPPTGPRGNYVIDSAHASALVTIHDNRTPPTPPRVWVEALEPATSEPYPSGVVAAGKVRVFRTGPTTGHLLVFLEYSGTASNGVDYNALPRWFVTIPAGTYFADLNVVALADGLVEGKETAILRVLPGPPPNFPLDIAVQEYVVEPRLDVARVTIFDRQTPLTLPTISVVADNPDAGECPPNADCALGSVTVAIRRAGELDYPLRVYLGFGGTAELDTDYRVYLPGSPRRTFYPPSVLLPAGAREVRATIDPIDDFMPEGDETVIVRVEQVDIDTSQVFPPVDYHVATNQATATVVIHDNDGPGSTFVGLEVIDRFAAETHPFQNAIYWGEFQITRAGDTNIELLVYLLPPTGTARFGVDYRLEGQYSGLPDVGPNAPVRIPRGFRSIGVRLYVIDDDLIEGTETAVISLSPPPAGTPVAMQYIIDPTRRSGEFLIEDNEPPANLPVISLEPVDREARETLAWCEPCSIDDFDRGEFRVVRTGDTNLELRVQFMAPQGTAQFGVDYVLDPFGDDAIVRIPAGVRSVNVRLFPRDDTLIEGDETAILTLGPPPVGPLFMTRYRVDPAKASVSIVIHDNDPATPRVEIVSPRDGEHFEAGDTIRLQARIIGLGTAEGWNVHFYDGDQPLGTTQSGGTLFWRQASGGRHVIMAAADTVAGIPGMDRLPADSVTIFVGPGPAWPVVSIGTLHEVEKTSEPCPACLIAPGVFTFTRTGPTTLPLTVRLQIDGTATPGPAFIENESPTYPLLTGGTASARADYHRLPDFITIPAGTNAARLTVIPFDDGLVEGPELVRVRIVPAPEVPPLGGYLANVHANEAIVVIGDDEPGAPEARLDIVEPLDGAQFAEGVPIQLSALSVFTRGEFNRPVEFFANGVLIGRSPAGPTRPSIPCMPNVHTIVWTNAPRGRHTVTARNELSLNRFVEAPPVHIVVGEVSSLPIVRIETLPRENAQSPEYCPPNADCAYGAFIVRRTGPTSRPLTVFLTSSGTATPGVDYAELPRSVTIQPGEATAAISLIPYADAIQEGAETVTAQLVQPAGGSPLTYAIDPNAAAATIRIVEIFSPEIVRIEATRRIAEETSDPLRRVPLRGEFTISRTGDTWFPLGLRIDVYMTYRGTATYGVDYPELSRTLVIPAGATSTTLEVVPKIDGVTEGIETLVATIATCMAECLECPLPPCQDILVDPTHAQATVFIRDDGITQASLRLTQPREGTEFNWGQTITLEANAIDLDGYISRVEFFDGDARIGESEITFIRPPDPGTPITHTFAWGWVGPGRHVLTARAFRPDGTAVTSQRVSITVGPRVTQPVLQFVQPHRNDVFSSREEIPILLRAFASNDVFLNAEIFANGVKIADASFCCWLCPCARPPVGQETLLQIPVRPAAGGPSPRPWQGWTAGHAGLFHLTARAVGERGTVVESGPVRIFVYDPHLCVFPQSDGSMALVIPEGSLAPGRYDVEASPDLRTWTRLGEFQPGNVAAFYLDTPPSDPRGRRFYRSVFYQSPLP